VSVWGKCVAVSLTVAAMAGCSEDTPSPPPAGGKVRAVATIFPLADVLARIGGADVEVGCLLEPGRTPHDFALTARHSEVLSGARLLVAVGLGVDDWAEQAVEAARAKGLKLVRLAEDPAFRKRLELDAQAGQPEAPKGDAGRSGLSDPHVWLDPVFMRDFAAIMAEALIEIDPAGRDGYVRRREAYMARLDELDAEYRRRLSGLRRRHFVTFHPAFFHVARRYGLTQLALHGSDAGGFGPERLERLVDFIKRNDVRAIFAEPQFPAEKLRVLAERTGCKISRLDPLGSPDVAGYDSYLAMMRSNLAALAAALGE